ncbi:MAG: RHS repeat domain-containing protein, partial [Gemmatimonadales bacterium]
MGGFDLRKASAAAVLLSLALGLGAPKQAFAQTCPTATQCVTYDALGRVTSVITTDGKQTIYSYDAAGNRTSVAVSGTATAPPTAADQAITYTFGGSAPPPISPSLGLHVTIVGVTPAQLGTTSFTSTQLTWTPPATALAGTDHFGYE